MATLEKETKSGGGHWYTLDGKPMHTVQKSNGDGERKTNLRDARKLNLLPSVTTIFGIMAKQGLEIWKQNKIIEATARYPKKPDETFEYYKNRILAKSMEETEQASTLGSQVHYAIEKCLDGTPPDPSLEQYVFPAIHKIKAMGIVNIQQEKVLVNKMLGYAGRVDLMAEKGDKKIVIDFKTRKTEANRKITPHEYQPMQISAYAMSAYGSLDNVVGANIYISTTEVGRMEVCYYDSETLTKEFSAFQHILALWRYSNNYDPRQA